MKIKHILFILKYKYSCKKWKNCMNLLSNQEWILCKDKKCPLAKYQGLTRAYKKTIGTYKIEEDPEINHHV